MLRLVKTCDPVEATESEESPVASPISVTIAREFSDPRLEIIRLLHEACEIEHSLMLQYLYAASSVKPKYVDLVGEPDPRRSDCLLGIAVQEMSHFKDVNRLLVKFGGSPNMQRQDFPYESSIYPFEMRLEPLSPDSLAKYVYAEAPAKALDEQSLNDPADRQFARNILARLRREASYNHIGTLYQKVLNLLDELPPGELPSHVVDVRETLARIKDEGEIGHFQFFKGLFVGSAGSLKQVSEPWMNPDSDDYPALPLPENPTALLGHENQIGDTGALALARLGNTHYWIVLSLLRLAYSAEKDAPLAKLSTAHMMNALYPLCLEMASAGFGMPFDPLSLGYAQGEGANAFAYIKKLLAEAREQSKEISNRELAERCSRQAEQSLATLERHLRIREVPPGAVGVVGSGPAGLAAACTLAARGVPVYLFEQAEIVGGKVHSFRGTNGRSFEHGVHGWWINYLNFDRLLLEAGVDLEDALKEAAGTSLVTGEGANGRVFPLRTFRWNIPSPINLLLQNLRAPYLKWHDTLGFLRFAIHLLAFSHERDYLRYDGISFQELMDDLRVPARIQHFILTPFILSFDFDVPEQISAACGLSGSQFYVVHDQRSILTRWTRGLPAEKIFDPLVDYLKRSDGIVLLKSGVNGVKIENGGVRGITYRSAARTPTGGNAAAQPETVLASAPVASLAENNFTLVESSAGGKYWVGRQSDNFSALDATCTHQGCSVNWLAEARKFQCPCHGGEFDAHGTVLQGPPSSPLAALETRLNGDALEIIGASETDSMPLREVIIAADTRAAQEIIGNSRGVKQELLENLAQLDTTPVVVVRLWFAEKLVIPAHLESGITPDAEVIDNFFFLNSFSRIYDREGVILEVQSYRVAEWLDRTDAEILAAVFRDLTAFCPAAAPTKLTSHKIQRHRALFTKYAPGKVGFRPRAESGTDGLYLAGDWTNADWSVWMMERAIVSGLRAANAVLKKRGLPEVEILRLSKESLTLRASRWMCKMLRRAFWKNYPASNTRKPAAPLLPDDLSRRPPFGEVEREEMISIDIKNFK